MEMNEMFADYCRTENSRKNEIFIEGFPSNWSEDKLKSYLIGRNIGVVRSVKIIRGSRKNHSQNNSNFAFVIVDGDVDKAVLKLNLD